MDHSAHLKLATRIHFALLREYGEKVEIADLISSQGEACEALWVCEASGDVELVELARQFKASRRAMDRAASTPAKGAASVAEALAAQASKQRLTHPIVRPIGRMPSKSRGISVQTQPGLDLSNAPGLDPAPPPVVRSRMLPPAWHRRLTVA